MLKIDLIYERANNLHLKKLRILCQKAGNLVVGTGDGKLNPHSSDEITRKIRFIRVADILESQQNPFHMY